ncbi:MAG TPA: response regulator transcription factor [Pseudonocardiaceae bacterium]
MVLAEDDVLLREGLASLLERSGFAVVGQAGGGPQLVALVREEAPELVVVDIRMPPTHTTGGLEAARVIRQEFPEIGIVVLSAHAEVEHAMELLASGRGSVICLRAGSPTWRSSSRPSSGSPGVVQWWIRRWWPSWSRRAGAMIR